MRGVCRLKSSYYVCFVYSKFLLLNQAWFLIWITTNIGNKIWIFPQDLVHLEYFTLMILWSLLFIHPSIYFLFFNIYVLFFLSEIRRWNNIILTKTVPCPTNISIWTTLKVFPNLASHSSNSLVRIIRVMFSVKLRGNPFTLKVIPGFSTKTANICSAFSGE